MKEYARVLCEDWPGGIECQEVYRVSCIVSSRSRYHLRVLFSKLRGSIVCRADLESVRSMKRLIWRREPARSPSTRSCDCNLSIIIILQFFLIASKHGFYRNKVRDYHYPFSATMSIIKVSGATLVDGNGETVILRGAGLGGWLTFV